MFNRTPIDDLINPGTTAKEAFLFAESAAEMVTDAMFDGIAEAPPETADYRPAEVNAIACWNCAHFQRTGLGDDEWPVGICHIWEAKVEGEAVCDKFTADATISQWPANEYPGEGDNEGDVEYSAEGGFGVEVFFSDDGEVEVDDTGLVTKAILRTGEWKKTPSSKGVIKKPLKVIRDGVSSAADRIISLSEIKDNFEKNAFKNVPIPLTDEENKDHKNLLRLNTGWVKKLWIEDLPNGMSKLMAGMQFTEPDARAKVKRGTYPDVSSGIFFGVERPDGERFNSALNHVVITHKPFMDGLGGFQFSDDGGDVPENIENFELADDPEGHKLDWPSGLNPEEKVARVQKAVDALLSIPVVEDEPNTYEVKELDGAKAVVFSQAADVTWDIEFSLGDEGVVNVPDPESWQLREIEASQEDEQPVEPDAASEETTVPRNESPLARARRQRVARLAKANAEGGVDMKVRDRSQVNFSDPADAEKYATELSDQNRELSRVTNKAGLEKRIGELKEMGFAEMPGFLAQYRDIFLSDDSEVAMVLLSHDDNDNETNRKSVTGIELADQLIASIPTDKEGKILFSGQALDTGTNEAPAETDDEEKDTPEKVEERTAAMADSLGVEGMTSGKEA